MVMNLLLIIMRMMRTIMMILRTMVAIRMTNGGWAQPYNWSRPTLDQFIPAHEIIYHDNDWERIFYKSSIFNPRAL